MVHEEQRSKSPFILLALLSVLVISTLVVASVYFMLPDFKSLNSKQNTSQQLSESAVMQDNIPPDNLSAETKTEPETGDQQVTIASNRIRQGDTGAQQPRETEQQLKAQEQTAQKQAAQNAPVNQVADTNLVKTALSTASANEQETRARGRQEQANDCGIRFTDNQLLVKNPSIE